jgi:malonyl CoA-acyl carrier protein transacylase
MRRVALVLPGRGSYTEKSLASIDPEHEFTVAAEALRLEADLESLVELDRAPRFEPARHLRPAHAAALIYLRSMIDAWGVLERDQVACVLGNSMGWYTALAAVGSLSFEDGFRLVQEMALLQEQGEAGGQLIQPVVDEEWRLDPELAAAVERALEKHAGEAFPSIDLGGYRVLAGTEKGLRALIAELPKVTRSRTTYPFRLAQHGPYHTELAAGVARAARERLARLEFRAPRIPLIDGLGRRHTPWSALPGELADYTFGDQVTRPYGFTVSVRVALREYAPERLVLTGPGNALGGVCGQILCAEGWRGLRSKADFEGMQSGERPMVESLDR